VIEYEPSTLSDQAQKKWELCCKFENLVNFELGLVVGGHGDDEAERQGKQVYSHMTATETLLRPN